MPGVEASFEVVGFDTDEPRVKALAGAESYMEEFPSATLAAALASGRYRPTTEAGDCRSRQRSRRVRLHHRGMAVGQGLRGRAVSDLRSVARPAGESPARTLDS
jgi:hypothetical protein